MTTFKEKLLQLLRLGKQRLSLNQRAEAFDAFVEYIASGTHMHRNGCKPERNPNLALRKASVIFDLETALSWADTNVKAHPQNLLADRLRELENERPWLEAQVKTAAMLASEADKLCRILSPGKEGGLGFNNDIFAERLVAENDALAVENGMLRRVVNRDAVEIQNLRDKIAALEAKP